MHDLLANLVDWEVGVSDRRDEENNPTGAPYMVRLEFDDIPTVKLWMERLLAIAPLGSPIEAGSDGQGKG